MITFTASVALLMSLAAPTMAMVNPTAVVNRISRRLLEDKTRSEQRVPVGAVEATVLLRERKQITPEASGFSSLSRARITTRIRTLKGARTPDARGERPSRRSIIDNAESMLVLPPSLVQTGGDATMQKLSRRTLRALTEVVNRIQVGE